MKKTATWVAAALFGAAALGAAERRESGSVTLAEKGRTTLVALPRDATASQRRAAEELTNYLARVTGGTVVVAGPGAAGAAVRFETADELGADGFELVARDGGIVVRGSGRRGCLNGAYELLERFAGVRWYASWFEVVPRAERVTAPAGLKEVQRPAFAMRMPFWTDVLRNRAFAARIRAIGNGLPGGENWREDPYGGNEFRFGGGLGSCHTFYTLLPPERHFAAHPEYYALVDGKRVDRRGQLCLTNPEVFEIVVSNVLERIRRDPGARYYGVSQNDCRGFCTCPACKAIDDEEGSHAGTMVRFVNAVAERVEREFPGVVIETLAYQYTRRPPKKTKLRRNVMPCLCTIECDFANPIATGSHRENVSFREDIRGWSAQTGQLYLWDYVTDFYHYPCLWPNLRVLQANVKFFRDNHVKDLFEQGAYQGWHANCAELKAWVLAKLLWDPEADVDALVRDFTDGYYGAAAPYVREDVDEMCALQQASGRPLSINEEVDLKGVPEEFFVRSRERWDKALAAVEDDPARGYNVRMGAFSLDYTMLLRLQLKKERDWTAAERAEAGRLARRVLAALDEAEHAGRPVRLGEWWENNAHYVDNWRRIAGWGVRPPDAAHAPDARAISLVPSIECSPKNGRLWATWYAGPTSGENSQNYCVLATSADGGATWREVLVADPDGPGPRRAFDPELWIAPDGKLRWTWCERRCAAKGIWNGGRTADGGEDRLMMLELSAEDEPAAGAAPTPRQIASGVMMCKPTVLRDGSWALPVARWYAPTSAVFAVSRDGGATFTTPRGGISLPEPDRLYDEHQMVEHADGSRTCLVRTRRGILECVSSDGGATWAPREPQRLRHASARVFFRKLASGSILLVKHGPLDANVGRRDLRAYLSDDDGKTWRGGLLLDAREGVSYPDGCQKPDGTVVLTYDRDRQGAQEILFCEFAEEDARAGRDVSGRVKLRRKISGR